MVFADLLQAIQPDRIRLRPQVLLGGDVQHDDRTGRRGNSVPILAERENGEHFNRPVGTDLE